MSGPKDGDWYVYTGEDGEAIAVAMHGRGPQGGWMGISLARMMLPSENKTKEQINAAARMMAAAPDMLKALKAAVRHAPIPPFGIDPPWVSDAEAAIAKATGEA